MNIFKRYRDELVAVLLLAVPFFFLRANLSDPSRATLLDRWLVQISAPVQWVAVKMATGASTIVQEYTYLVDVKRENDRLTYDNARLKQRIRDLEALDGENARLKQLLSLREQLPGQAISARVIAKDISPLFRVIRVRLDRGRDERVTAGMPVVSAEGLVGQISRVFDRYADVMLTVDEGSAVDVIIPRTGSRGILRGTGESEGYKARIQYLLRADEIQVGDAVITSGLGRRFPANLQVGTIAQVDRREFGLYQLAEVTPAVNLSRLEEVYILTSSAREASSIRSSAEGPRPSPLAHREGSPP
ncbi:MAG: rod shape-determining protein MreC [Polyangiales bacterium]